jgi:hypothetical protein
MSQLLPYGDFKYSADKKKCKQICKTFIKISHDSKLHKNYSHKALHNKTSEVPIDPYRFNGFMRVHLSYTAEQTEKVKLFPPLPTRRVIEDKELSEYMKKLKKQIAKTNTTKSKSEKLVYDLHDKNSYCIYSVYLKFLLEHDLVCLDAVYEVIEMKVGYVMRDYITEMTKNRQIAEDDITKADTPGKLIDAKARKEYYKLKANSVFGKTIQSDEKFSNSTFVRNLIQFHKATMGKIHMDSVIIGPNIVEVRTKKDKPTIKSPKYLGSAILGNSKMLMLDFIYNCLWKVYTPHTAKILYSDTDSIYVKTYGFKG